MDIERLLHQNGYRQTVIAACLVSVAVVVMVAILGRGAAHLKGALTVDEPTALTVITLTEPKLESGLTVSNVTWLRTEQTSEEKPMYAYTVTASDQSNYFMKIRFNRETGMWEAMRFERLHGAPGEETSQPQ